MKTILTLLLLATSAFSADINVSITVTDRQQASIKAAADKANAAAKTAWESDEAAKKAADSTYTVKPFVPVTVVNYFKARVAELLGSYAAAEIADTAAAPVNQTAHQKFLALPEAERVKIRNAIDAAAAANP